MCKFKQCSQQMIVESTPISYLYNFSQFLIFRISIQLHRYTAVLSDKKIFSCSGMGNLQIKQRLNLIFVAFVSFDKIFDSFDRSKTVHDMFVS